MAKNSDTVLLQAVDMDDGGPYEIAGPRAITTLDSYVPPCELVTPCMGCMAAFANALPIRPADRSVKAYRIYCLEAGTHAS